MKSIHIFKAGKHTSAGGTTLEFSEDALARAAEAYNPDLAEAPIVVGHPKDNGPAFGWIAGLEARDTGLHATPRQVNADFAELVSQGAYKKVSASFYAPDSDTNPVPGTWYLRHVGFLGAQPPAVKGLEGVQFSEADEGVVEFSAALTADDIDDSQAEGRLIQRIAEVFGLTPRTQHQPEPDQENTMDPKELEQQQAALKAEREALEAEKAEFAEAKAAVEAEKAKARAAAFAERTEKLIKDGKLAPAHKEAVLAFANTLSAETQVEFSEGETKPQAEALFALLESAQPGPDFSEHSGDNGEPKPAELTDQEIANKAIAYRNEQQAKGINVSFTEAVKQVTK